MLAAAGVTLGVCAIGIALLRLTVAAPQHCPELTPASLAASASASAGWIEVAQYTDGRYVYEYDATDDSLPDDYNVVRHAGVTMSLYQAAALGDLSRLHAADRGMTWMRDNLIHGDDWVALQNPDTGRVKLGASSLMLAGLTQRRLATGDESYDMLMQRLARFLVIMQLPDGAMLNYWDPASGAPDPSVRSRYATGEALWALAQMHRHFPDDGWDEPSWRIADYLALHRDEVEGLSFPPWPDQWAAYSLAEMGDWPLKDHHIEYAPRALRTLRLPHPRRGAAQRWGNQRGLPRAALPRRGAGHVGRRAQLALAPLPHRRAPWRPSNRNLAERAICGAGILASRQVTSEGSAAWPSPALAAGAWFRDGVTRMDDQQHALSGLALTQGILSIQEETQVSGFFPTLLLIFAAVNPPAVLATVIRLRPRPPPAEGRRHRLPRRSRAPPCRHLRVRRPARCIPARTRDVPHRGRRRDDCDGYRLHPLWSLPLPRRARLEEWALPPRLPPPRRPRRPHRPP